MAYKDDVLALSPTAYFRLGESSGSTIAVDEMSSYIANYEGALQLGLRGIVPNPSDETDTSIKLSDKTHKVTIAGLSKVPTFSMSFWIAFSDLGSYDLIVYDYDVIAGKVGLAYFSSNLYWVDALGNHSFGFTPQRDEVYFIVLSCDNSQLTLYVDGVAKNTITLDVPWSPETIGGSNNNNQTLKAIVDEVAWFSTALSSVNIDSINPVRLPDGFLQANLEEITSNLVAVYNPSGHIASSLSDINSLIGIIISPTSVISSTLEDINPLLIYRLYRLINISLVIEGKKDSLIDFEYQLKSFSVNLSNGQISNFSFQLPKKVGYIDAYNKRPNGDLVVHYLGDEIVRCTPKWLNYNVGATSETLSLKGSSLESYNNPKTIDIDNQVTKINVSSSKKRVYTLFGFIAINPLDSIIYNSETVQIEKIGLRVDARNFILTLTSLLDDGDI